MSGASVGLDTNILVYTVDSQDAGLCRRAQDIVRLAAESDRCVIALQTVAILPR